METEMAREAQRLTEHYSQMYDEELLNLAADAASLTEIAQQVLSAEIRKRGLRDKPEQADPDSSPAAEIGEDDKPAHQYTWKTLLCECDEREQAWQMYEALKRAGIESWIERPYSKFYVRDFQVLVAADQLDQAREIAARPIPQDIVDESKLKVPEFEPPTCPHCGAADPVLESVDPCNAWVCEACGSQWTESAEGLDDTAEP
jgi:hypothetical protein